MDTGTLRYSPKLLGTPSSKWWLVIDCDPEFGKYYRNLYYLSTHKCHKLQRPAWESHITVIRDEEPTNKPLWEKYNGITLEFNVITQINTNGYYYWFTVECDKALDIREELGLPRQPAIPLHVSIGHGET